MHYIDLVFVFLLVIVQPVYGAISSRKLSNDVAAGFAVNRISMFNETMAMQWLALLALGVLWTVFGRPPGDLGFRSPVAKEVMIGMGFIACLCAVLFYSWYVVSKMSPAEKSAQREGLGDLFHYLPQSRAEFRYSILVSMTAGIVEEIIYRGFVIWLLSMHMSIWIAVLLSSIGFGLAHSYQGLSGAIKVGLVGLTFALLYVFTGSIWFPILAHVVMDILQMATIRELFVATDDSGRRAWNGR